MLISGRGRKYKAAMNAGAEVSLLAKWLPSVNAKNKATDENAIVVCDGSGSMYWAGGGAAMAAFQTIS